MDRLRELSLDRDEIVRKMVKGCIYTSMHFDAQKVYRVRVNSFF
jgi:hypothetical protein